MVSSGSFTGNIEISRLGSQLRKVVFGETRPHSESARTTDGADLIINSNDGSNTEINNIATQLALNSGNDGYIIKVLDQNSTGSTAYFKWNGSTSDWEQTTAAYSTFRLPDIGLDFGVGSDKLTVENSALLLQALNDTPEKVEALFSEVTVENAFDQNTQTNRSYQGISYALDDFISNFLSGDDGTGYKGAYQAHIDSVKTQNERIDDKIEQLERYLKSREDQLSWIYENGRDAIQVGYSTSNLAKFFTQKIIQMKFNYLFVLFALLSCLSFLVAVDSRKRRSSHKPSHLCQATFILSKDYLNTSIESLSSLATTMIRIRPCLNTSTKFSTRNWLKKEFLRRFASPLTK